MNQIWLKLKSITPKTISAKTCSQNSSLWSRLAFLTTLCFLGPYPLSVLWLCYVLFCPCLIQFLYQQTTKIATNFHQSIHGPGPSTQMTGSSRFSTTPLHYKIKQEVYVGRSCWSEITVYHGQTAFTTLGNRKDALPVRHLALYLPLFEGCLQAS